MTNQASEDELDTILTLLENSVSVDTSRRMAGGRSGESPKTTHARAKTAIQSLIRTEKLKARIDELEEATAEVTHWSIDDPDSAIKGYSGYRLDVLKAELTKLEAEL